MNIHIPVFGTTTYYQADDLVEYNGQVYVCDKQDAVGNFNRSDWHHAIVDIHIDSAVGHDPTFPIRYEIRCLLAPDDFEIMSFSLSSRGLCAESVVAAVQDISDKFSVRNVYLSRFGTPYIRSMLSKMGYSVLYEPRTDETYIDEVVRITKEKSRLKDEDSNLVRLYALLALVKGKDVTFKDVHDAWAMDMNFKPRTPQCYGHAHKSIVPFDRLKVETQDLDNEYVEAIKEVANMISK